MGDLFDGIFPNNGVTRMLLDLMGTTGIITQNNQDSYNPLSGTTTNVTELTSMIYCTSPLRVKKEDIDGTNVLMSDQYVIADDESISGNFDDYNQGIINVRDINYNIIGISPIFTEHDTGAIKFYLRENNK